VIALRRLGRARRPAANRAFCQVDQWAFDPRYTQGQCPICGWKPEGARAYPTWMAMAMRVDWDLLALFLFADLLVLLGLVVARAAGLLR
jgi:hypothetical protein